MFRNRTSQKPSDELYRDFRATFPQLASTSSSTIPAAITTTATAAATTETATATATTLSVTAAATAASLLDPLDLPLNPRSLDSRSHDLKHADSSVRSANEPWTFGTSGLTPSLMDPNHSSFNMFANPLSGYYTPTPGGTNTLYHHQAGDLHTPSFAMGLGTPLSLPTSESALHAGQQPASFHGFQTHVAAQHFQNLPSFLPQPSQGFPPQHFTHQPTFDTIEGPLGESPVDDLAMDLGSIHQPQHHSPDIIFRRPDLQTTMQPPPLHSSGEKFRYHVTLNAPTAMIKNAEEIPITYLNKGQAYTLNVVDRHTPHGTLATCKYRTFVRVSFEDGQQRAKPAACWQLWKEGRGTNEAHHRGGRLQAVEYVDPGQSGGAEDPSKPKVELESASFDGFSVVWTPPPGGNECPISVRFNFLSTDFSHSKGVKGIPVRLCAKTELVESPAMPSLAEPEVCYCKVKLFRDHGAERKLSNDIAHVKKTIDKLNQQIAQLESGVRDLGKRKRSGSLAKGLESRPAKLPKHRRTWSMTSVASNGGRGSAEDDLHTKLMTLQDMFTSTRPASMLHLRGEPEDDPDQFPVKLSGQQELPRNDSTESSGWEKQSQLAATNSQAGSPTPSSNNSLVGSRKDSSMQLPTPIGGPSRVNSNDSCTDSQRPDPMDPHQNQQQEQLQSPPNSLPTKVASISPHDGVVSGWIEALGVDHGYRPPQERVAKPVASFYVRPSISHRPATDRFYRAIYLSARTLADFTAALAIKCNIPPGQVFRTYRVNPDGLHILFDDECVRELSEGQDMTAEFRPLLSSHAEASSSSSPSSSPIKPKREWDAVSADLQYDGDMLAAAVDDSAEADVSSAGYELELVF